MKISEKYQTFGWMKLGIHFMGMGLILGLISTWEKENLMLVIMMSLYALGDGFY